MAELCVVQVVGQAPAPVWLLGEVLTPEVLFSCLTKVSKRERKGQRQLGQDPRWPGRAGTRRVSTSVSVSLGNRQSLPHPQCLTWLVEPNIIFVSKDFHHQGQGPRSLCGLTLVLASCPLEMNQLTYKSAGDLFSSTRPGEHRPWCLSTSYTSFYLIA